MNSEPLNNQYRRFIPVPSLDHPRWLIPVLKNNTHYINYFNNYHFLKKLYLIFRIYLNIWFRKYFLVEKKIIEKIYNIFNFDTDLDLIVYFGAPGAYQKYILIFVDEFGKPRLFVKVSKTKNSIATLKNEEKTLRLLSNLKIVKDSVPKVEKVIFIDKTLLLALTPKKGKYKYGNINKSVFDWLILIFTETKKKKPFIKSNYFRRVILKFDFISGNIEEDTKKIFEDSIKLIKYKFKDFEIPLGLAHRDFAPWNILTVGSKINVIDWEMAENEFPPLYDFFHFYAIQSAFKNKKKFVYNRKKALALISVVWPSGKNYIDLLYLCYLLDQSLLYLEARFLEPDNGSNRILEWLLKQIREELHLKKNELSKN
ncbi:MAG TPA: hypothetical protein DCY12_01285 [Candidatus Atribacteria bacterium]|nr:hypothetical protein [Candidatus Atribacteria bacterium]